VSPFLIIAIIVLTHRNNSSRVARYIAPPAHIILIPSQQVFVLTTLCYVFSGKAANTHQLYFFGLTYRGCYILYRQDL